MSQALSTALVVISLTDSLEDVGVTGDRFSHFPDGETELPRG